MNALEAISAYLGAIRDPAIPHRRKLAMKVETFDYLAGLADADGDTWLAAEQPSPTWRCLLGHRAAADRARTLLAASVSENDQ